MYTSSDISSITSLGTSVSESTDYTACERLSALSFIGGTQSISQVTLVDEDEPSILSSTEIIQQKAALSGNSVAVPSPWKPFTLRAYTLSGVIAFCLLLIWVLEFLTIYKSKHDAVSFADENGNFTSLQSFSYLYLPTILAVCLGMLYSWIDLDVKRLEPFFQLSHPDGALAQESLTLHYPLDFLVLVPLKAAKLRHWSVFFAGIGMMLVFWVVTPLQSAIFTPATFYTLIHQPRVAISTGLIPLAEQPSSLNMDFMNKAYESLWLSAPLPAFVTPQFAVSPCKILLDIPSARNRPALEIESIAYWSELECRTFHTDLTVEALENSKINVCGVAELFDAITLDHGTRYRVHSVINYIPYWKWNGPSWSHDGEPPYLGLNSSCSVSAAHDVLILWAGNSDNPEDQIRTNVTALFCTPKYYSQPVKATLVLPDFQVLSKEPLGPPSSLSSSTFDATNFEYLIGLGQSSVNLTGDWPDVTAIQQGLKVEQLNVSPPYGNMVGFALGNRSISVQDYSDPRKLQQAFESAHQLLFALAVNQLHGNLSSRADGEVYGKFAGIIMVPGFAIAVELALVMISVSTLGVLIVTWNRHNKLLSDPASIEDLVRLLPVSKHLDPLFYNGRPSTLESQQAFYNQKFKLTQIFEAGCVRARLLNVRDENSENQLSLSDDKSQSPQRIAQGARPLELTYPVGILFGSTLLLVIIILAILLQRAHALGGLPRPSNNIIARQILINYIPTAFATILEPIWVLINRLLCILQPFEALRTCDVPAFQSIGLKYTSLPPQLVVFRAMRAKHFLLASVCTIALLANPLAVALSSVFQDSIVPQAMNLAFSQPHQPILTGFFLPYDPEAAELPRTQPLDHYYVLKSNFTDAAPLPPWTTRDLFFLPFVADSDPPGDNVRFQAVTRGFGISSNCVTLSSSAPGSTELELASDGGLHISFSTANAKDPDQASCIASGLQGKIGDPYSPNVGWNSFESIHSFENCSRSVFVADWFRPNFAGTFDSENRPMYYSLDYLVLSCEAKLRTAEFLTTVDQAQQIVAAEQISPFEYDLAPYMSHTTPSIIIEDLNSLMSYASQAEQVLWHTDAHAREYFNTILKTLLNGTNVDPASQLPPASVLGPMTEDLYTRVFAILLGLSPTAFVENKSNNTISGKVFFDQPRIVMNPVMTIIAIAILSLNFIVTVVLYAKRPGRWLPRIPMSIADVLTFAGASKEVGRELDYGEMFTREGEKGTRWGFGKFLGRDDRSKIGIERWPFVVPLSVDGFYDERRYNRRESVLSKGLSLSTWKLSSFSRATRQMRQRLGVFHWVVESAKRHWKMGHFGYSTTKAGMLHKEVARSGGDSKLTPPPGKEEWTCTDSSGSIADIETLSGFSVPLAN